jgi:hypothetical protein
MLWLAVLGVSVSACVTEPEIAVDVSTDGTEYRLERVQGGYVFELSAAVANLSEQTVFLERSCGYGDEPHRTLLRPEGDDTPVRVGEIACAAGEARDPIPLAPGQTLRENVRFVSPASPNATPQVRMEERTGMFRLAYQIRTVPRRESGRLRGVLPQDRTTSGIFEVLPPS